MNRLHMPQVIICLAILVLTTCSSAVLHKTELYPNKQARESWTEVKESSGEYVRHGAYQSWHANGQQRTVGNYDHGQKVGLWTTKSEQGQLIEWQDYENGLEHGLYVSYHATKNKKCEGRYARGKREGSWRWWYADAMLREIGDYTDGLKQGEWLLYSEVGQKKREASYLDGVLNGRYIEWGDNGLRRLEGQYRDGVKEGTWTTWDEMGQIASTEAFESGRSAAAGDD